MAKAAAGTGVARGCDAACRRLTAAKGREVPVGLVGLARKTILVRAGTSAGRESTAAVKFVSAATTGTPPAEQCGRGVFTDIHVSSGDARGGTFPGNCTTTGFTNQEKALLVLMMDLASCIQDDKTPPELPVIK